jgi:deoxyadenosine kinase
MVWSDRDVVQDRSIYEDVIFGKMLKDAGIMSDLDFETYRSLYLNMTNFLHRPDLIIYLDTSPEVALERVRERARPCENGVDLEYLKALKAGYEEWLVDVEPRIPVLRLDWNEFHDTNEVIAKINQKLADRRGLVF